MARTEKKVDARISGAGKAVLYGRYSSHSQKDASIEQQFRECREYAKRKGIQIIGEYADHALSGQTDQRPEFQRMIRDAKRGRFQYVITWKVDRFARNRYDSATYKARLKASGVSVLYAKEDIPEGPEGILLESVLEGSAEYYSANLAQNIRRGMEDNARECKANGHKLLGYRTGPDGRYEEDPVSAPIVRLIFERYNAGVTQAEITKELNEKGLKTVRGYAFDKNSLTRILKNEKYLGIYIFGDIRVEGGMPQLVDRETFDAVQLKLARNKRAPAHRWDIADYQLTGKIFCGKCGAQMVGRAGTSKTGAKHNYYACVNRTRAKSCDKRPVQKDLIEQLVVSLTLETVLTEEGINRIADRVVAYQQEQRAASIIASLELKLAEVEKGLQNLMAAIEAGIITPTTKERMFDLEAQKAELVDRIEYEKIEQPLIPREEFVQMLRAMAAGDPRDEKFRTRIIEGFVSAVYLYDDHFVVTYHFTDRGNGEHKLTPAELEALGLSDFDPDDPDPDGPEGSGPPAGPSSPDGEGPGSPGDTGFSGSGGSGGGCSPLDASAPPFAAKTNTTRIVMIPDGFALIAPLPAAYSRK